MLSSLCRIDFVPLALVFNENSSILKNRVYNSTRHPLPKQILQICKTFKPQEGFESRNSNAQIMKPNG